MSKLRIKYNYNNKCDKNRFTIDDAAHSSDECNISQKIKNLELEGLKLRSQVDEILHETNETMSNRTCDSANDSSITPCDDSARFDLHHSNIWSNEIGRQRVDYKNQESGLVTKDPHLDEYRHRLDHLQHKLKQDSFAYNLEKERLCGNIEELKRVNFRLQSDIEKQEHDVRAREMNLQSIIERLRCNLSQLLTVNKKQEETLIESGERLEHLNSAEASVHALEQLRELLIDIEYHHGLRLNNSDNVDSSDPIELISIVDKCFKEYNCDLDKRNRKIKDLEDEIIQIKRTLTHEKEKSLHDLRNQLAYAEEQNNYLKQNINDISENADREIDRLREENIMIKSKMEEDMTNSTTIIDDLEHNFQELSNKNKKMNEAWLTEKKTFEKVLDNNEKQIAIIRSERDVAINQKSSLSAKLDATQNQLVDTETTLLQLQSEKYSSEKQIEMIKKQNKEMENSIALSKKNLEGILKTVWSCGDNDSNVNNNYDNTDDSFIDNDNDSNPIWKPKKYQIEEAIHLIQGLNKKEKDFESKYEKLKKEYELIEKKWEDAEFQRRSIEQSLNAKQLDIDCARNENGHITSLLANRNCEIERLTAERDYYFQLLNEKTEEVATIKTEKHRLAASLLSNKIDIINSNYLELEERCRLLECKGDINQNNDLQRAPTTINGYTGKDHIIREDRNRLLSELKETRAAYEDLLSHRDEECQKFQKTLQENWKLQADLKNANKEFDDLIAENRKIKMKLKDSESEITNLCRELQNSNDVKSKKHLSFEKKISELLAELTTNKTELKIAHDRIKYLEKGLSKSKSKTSQPVILNDLTAKPLDSDNLKVANTRLNSLEQQMLTLGTTQNNLKEENFHLTNLLQKVTSQNERMSEELETYVEENKKLRKDISSIENHRPSSQTRGSRVPKKTKVDFHSNSDKRVRRFIDPPFDNYSNDVSNDESLKQLREDLQSSIKEAKRLLSNSPLNDSNDEHNIPSKPNDPHNCSQRSSTNQSSSGSNNNNAEKATCSDQTDSSTINTRRSELGSLTEADRHITLPLNKPKQLDVINRDDARPNSAVEELLSPNKTPKVYVRKSKGDSYMLEEKIKHLLSTEG